MTRPPRLVFLLHSAQRRLQQWVASLPWGGPLPAPTPAQAGLLFALAGEEGRTMGQLGHQLDLAPSAVTGLVQRTEALGWVTRQTAPGDARSQQVRLSDSGRARLPALRAATQAVQQQLCAGFTDAELATVARWLTHVQQLGQQASGSGSE